MQPEAAPLLPWIFTASQYIGVFAGYAGVVSAFVVLIFAAVVVIARPIMAFREKQAESRRYDFLEMFDDDRYNEVMGKARRAANERMLHYRLGGCMGGVGSRQIDQVDAGLNAALTNLERQMDKARARRTKQDPKLKTTTGHMLAVHKRLMTRKRIIEAKEKALGIEPDWDTEVW